MADKKTTKKSSKKKTLSRATRPKAEKAPTKPRTPPVIPPKPTADAQSIMEKKAQAYRNLFNKGEDAEIVIADMMATAGISRFRGFNGPGANDERLKLEGIQQFVFGILNKVGLTDDDIRTHIMSRLTNRRRQ